jgi:hypothetical protein
MAVRDSYALLDLIVVDVVCFVGGAIVCCMSCGCLCWCVEVDCWRIFVSRFLGGWRWGLIVSFLVMFFGNVCEVSVGCAVIQWVVARLSGWLRLGEAVDFSVEFLRLPHL